MHALIALCPQPVKCALQCAGCFHRMFHWEQMTALDPFEMPAHNTLRHIQPDMADFLRMRSRDKRDWHRHAMRDPSTQRARQCLVDAKFHLPIECKLASAVDGGSFIDTADAASRASSVTRLRRNREIDVIRQHPLVQARESGFRMKVTPCVLPARPVRAPV